MCKNRRAKNANLRPQYEQLHDETTPELDSFNYHNASHDERLVDSSLNEVPPQDETRPEEEEEDFGWNGAEDDSFSADGGTTAAIDNHALLTDTELEERMLNCQNLHEESKQFSPEKLKDAMNKKGHEEYQSIHLDDDNEEYDGKS